MISVPLAIWKISLNDQKSETFKENVRNVNLNWCTMQSFLQVAVSLRVRFTIKGRAFE